MNYDSVTSIAIFGAGRIGVAAKHFLNGEGYHNVTLYDIGSYNEEVFDKHDVFLCATPWQGTKYIVENVVKRPGKLYFDMTEDVEIGRIVREGSKSVMIPHCGLAPGAVSIIAASMLPANCVDIRVGAIPVTPTGALKYHLTWSTDGLVNEYLKLCPAIIDNELVQLPPLDNLTQYLDDVRYESFNTSGGIGTLAETLSGTSEHVRYQTIRYQGHRDLMRFLLDDLGFKDRQDELVTLLDEQLPRGGDDKIVIWIDNDDKSYHREILGCGVMTAIQRTTAAGVVAAMVWAMRKGLTRIDGQVDLRPGNWLANEDIPRSELQDIDCWKSVYEDL
jgi:saccharopine dehydrogenase-like NADP-dependent oxidoreductase